MTHWLFLSRSWPFLLVALLMALAVALGSARVAQGATLTVTKTADTDDGICDADCSLREAIAAASSGDEIILPAGTYTLTLGAELVIDQDLTLTGAGSAITIIQAATDPGVTDFRVFNILSDNDVAISGVTIRHGNTDTYGGGICSAIGSTLTLTGSTVSGNTAGVEGGGIYTNNDGTLELANTLIASNSAPSSPDCRGLLMSLGYNLVGNNSGCDFPAASGDLIGTAASPINPLLGPLQDNGGATFTQALLPGSPAIDAGNPAAPGSSDTACPATDQRGVARPQGAACDIGAFEVDGLPPGNNPPVALDDAYSVEEDSTLAVAAPGCWPTTPMRTETR
jgi:CSLREA domain-containing protein